MARADKQLDRDAVAAIAGISVDTLDTYKRDGRAPKPDGYIGRSPWWYASTISKWDKERRKVPGRVPGANVAPHNPRAMTGQQIGRHAGVKP